MWDLGADKAPGSDRFPLFFYRQFCDVIGKAVVSLVNQFGDSRARLDRINYSQIILMPKKDGPREVRDFRPIFSKAHSKLSQRSYLIDWLL